MELLEKICTGEGAAKCVTAVYAFGSWSRGALEVGDVDIDIEYDPRRDPEVSQQVLDALVAGRDWNGPVRKALKPRRSLQVLYGKLEMLGEPVLIYQDGDDLAAALARVYAIRSDPEAGRADREPVHPVLEPVADALSRPSLITLGTMVGHGLISLSVSDLPDVALWDIRGRAYRDFVASAWSETSPLARAAQAGGAALLSRKLTPRELLVLGRSPLGASGRPRWAIECREGKLRRFAYDLGHGFDGWLYVVRPERKQPLRALEITAPETSVLHKEDFELNAWLLEHAPQIQQIGSAPG